MYDGVTASNLPMDGQLVAGYVDGQYAWKQADWNRFPDATKVRIAVFPWTNDGDVLDCEPGDATPAQCPAWIRMRQAAGLARPTIYCSKSAMAAVQNACAGLDYDLWIEDWTGVPHLVDGSVATQYAARGTYDVSLVNDTWMVPPPVVDPQLNQFIGALAYVCDDLGDRLDKVRDMPLNGVDNEIHDIVQEMQRVRLQFLGERP
jgi:hypothetical protein